MVPVENCPIELEERSTVMSWGGAPLLCKIRNPVPLERDLSFKWRSMLSSLLWDDLLRVQKGKNSAAKRKALLNKFVVGWIFDRYLAKVVGT